MPVRRFEWPRFSTPQLALAPSLSLVLVSVYAFTAWSVLLSLTDSKILPDFHSWVGLHQYARLWSSFRWRLAVGNLVAYSLVFIPCAMGTGLILAILVDRQIRAEGFFRTLYLYPMALSSIVVGAAWKWILSPGMGIEKLVRGWGFPDFRFEWLVDSKMAIYTVVIADVWKASGFTMILFLAGLRAIDQNLVRAAMIDGAGVFQTYRRIILPLLRPVFASVFIVLIQRSLLTFDMALALTNGGPGFSSDMPAIFMVQTSFGRSELGLGAASAVMLLAAVMAIVIPYFVFDMRKNLHA